MAKLASGPSRGGLHDQTVERIGTGVIDGSYQPGQRLATQDELAEELGVSRTVIREAVRLLSDKGLLKSRPKIGTTVAEQQDWNLADADVLRWLLVARQSETLAHVAEVRLVVEPAAAGLAAKRRTEAHVATLNDSFQRMTDSVDNYPAYIAADLDFHGTILEAGSNPLLNQMLGTVRAALEGVRQVTVQVEEGPGSTLELHGRVRDAILDKDSTKAVAVMAELIEVSNEHLYRRLRDEAR